MYKSVHNIMWVDLLTLIFKTNPKLELSIMFLITFIIIYYQYIQIIL